MTHLLLKTSFCVFMYFFVMYFVALIEGVIKDMRVCITALLFELPQVNFEDEAFGYLLIAWNHPPSGRNTQM